MLKGQRRAVLGVHWKDWCWSWNSNTLATSREELTHWKRLWFWEALGSGGEGGDRGWDGWMASLTRWTWVGVNSGRWWWPGRPGVLRFMGSQRVRHDWVTELNWCPSSQLYRWCEGTGTLICLIHCQLEWKTVEALWKTVWQFQKYMYQMTQPVHF